MLPGVGDALVYDLADVDGVAQDPIQVATAEAPPTGPRAPRRTQRCDASAPIQLRLQMPHTAKLQVQPEDLANQCGLRLVDDESALVRPVADRRRAAHPHALLLGGGDLVADALARDLALELGEGQQYV